MKDSKLPIQFQQLNDENPSVRDLSTAVLGDMLEYEMVDLNAQQLIIYKLSDLLAIERQLWIIESILNALTYCCYRAVILPIRLIKKRYSEFDANCRAQADVILECALPASSNR